MNYQTGSRIKEPKVSTMRRDWDTFQFHKISSYSALILHYPKKNVSLLWSTNLYYNFLNPTEKRSNPEHIATTNYKTGKFSVYYVNVSAYNSKGIRTPIQTNQQIIASIMSMFKSTSPCVSNYNRVLSLLSRQCQHKTQNPVPE
jgi:hypothetical protein